MSNRRRRRFEKTNKKKLPPGAVMNSVAQVLALRARRINAEASRLKQLYGGQSGR